VVPDFVSLLVAWVVISQGVEALEVVHKKYVRLVYEVWIRSLVYCLFNLP